jgi:GT2 family glycosyltransferase
MTDKRKKKRRKPASRKIRKPRPARKSGYIFRAFPIDTPEPRPVDLREISPLRRMEERFELSLAEPKVSVVIANHNGVDSLWHCLFSLKTQTYPPHEILLVDNASSDSSVPFVRANYPQVRILECQENFGPAMAVNLGAKTAQGDLVAVMDGDLVATPDWLANLVKDFRGGWPKFGVLGSVLEAPSGERKGARPPFWTLNFLGCPVEGYLEDPREVFHPESGAFLYPRFLAPEGPFDSDYFLFQGGEYLGWKMRLARRDSALSRSAKVFRRNDPERPGIPEWKAVYYRTRNRWLNLLLFYRASNLLRVLPWVAAESLFRMARGLATGFQSLLGTLLALGWLAFHPALILRKRRAVQGKRKVPDREVLRCVSGRLVGDGVRFSRTLNFLSLAYCWVVGLEVLESR